MITRLDVARGLFVALFACWGAQAVHAACTTLAPGVVASTTLTDSYWQFDQESYFWTAVGVRPSSATDWDAYMYTAGATATCTNALLATSLRTTGVDFVIGDFNAGANAFGTYTFGAHMFSGGGTGTIEWAGTPQLLTVNDVRQNVTTGPADVLDMWDVFLSAGTTYTFSLDRYDGAADVHLLLFRNTGGGTYWTGRSGAQFETTGSVNYTAPASGYYGVVVVNDNGAAGHYGVCVGTCTSPVALAAGTAVSTSGPENWYSFNQQANYWTGVAVRGTGSDDWDMWVGSSANTQPWPSCINNDLGNSVDVPPVVDFVVGDFNYNAPGTYYARADLYQQNGTHPGLVQWDSGADRLTPNAPMIQRNVTPNQLIEVWDVFLYQAYSYSFVVDNANNTGSLATYLFAPSGGTQWLRATDPNCIMNFPLPSGSSGIAGINPPRDGWYGVVVINDQGGSGYYGIAIGSCAFATSSTLPLRSPQSGSSEANFFNIGVAPDPLGSYWQAAGIRTDYWQVSAYDPTNPTGGWFGCYSPYFKTSIAAFQSVKFVAGDLETCPRPPGSTLGINASEAFAVAQPPVTVEWDRADHDLPVNPSVAVTGGMDPSTILRTYRVSLSAGLPYTFTFGCTPSNLGRMYLFHPGTACPAYWVANEDSVMSLATGSRTYTPPTTGDYLVVVTNDAGVQGSYTLAAAPGALAVDDLHVGTTRFTGITPNPGRGDEQLEFALAQPSAVGFEVLDLAGRRVRSFAPARYAAGLHALPWNGGGAAGPLAPGLYMVRMEVDGRTVGERKYTALR